LADGAATQHAGCTRYRDTITKLARTHKLGLNWLDEQSLRRLGANAFLAVSAANVTQDAGIAHLTYRPPGNKSRSSARSVSSHEPIISQIASQITRDSARRQGHPV